MIRNHFACPVCATTWTTDCTVQAIEPCPSCGLVLMGLLQPADLHDAHVKQALDIDLPGAVPTRVGNECSLQHGEACRHGGREEGDRATWDDWADQVSWDVLEDADGFSRVH